jgi:hypothetical protein
VPEPAPREEASSPPPSLIRITAEIIVQVVDETALRQAAVELVDEQDHACDDDRELERALVQPDNAEAVALLADLTAAADAIPGVEVLEATLGADAIDEPGAEDLDEGEIPDFAALFPLRPAGDDSEQETGWQLTPRTAAVLHVALSMLADDAYQDIEEFGGQPVAEDGQWGLFDRLPRISWREDTQWRRQAARAFDDLTDDIAQGRWPVPRCNAEELALHLAIAEAPLVIDMTDIAETAPADLPEHPDDLDWDMCSEVMFQDHDILMLDDPAVDGIEDPESAVNREFGIGDLRPSNWFRPFNNVEPRDPHRGFRR